ncbi:uncharacterized protein LOC142973349 isoform X2 [Anticarsia gemmatalis]
MVLNESANSKRILFNNISDIKIQIEIEPDCKPVIPTLDNYSEVLFKDSINTLEYNDTTIKKIKEDKEDCSKTQITVNEFLNSVKMESDDDCDQNYELDIEYDQDTDSDYHYEKPLKSKKKSFKKCKKKESKRSIDKYPLMKPIKPVYLQDVGIVKTEIKRKPSKPKEKSTGRKSVCPHCGKLIFSSAMKRHLINHTAIRSYKCDQCRKSFFTINQLTAHKELHNEPNKFKCDQCIASFMYKTGLLSHLKMVHSDEKKHVCEICKKAFKKKSQMNRHIKIHSFGKKPVPCELCSMTFYTKDALRHHMRVHTGDRPFKCDICSQPYSYKHDFNRHCLKKHGVFLKRRSVNIMNEEVLERERALMRNVILHAQGVIMSDDIVTSTFEGPQGALAYKQLMKAIEARQIPISF